MDRNAEGTCLEVEERHLDRGNRLGHPARRLIHSGQRRMDVERVGAGQRGRETAHCHVDVVGRHRRVARRGIDVAPALDAGVRRHPNEQAALDGGDAVHAVDRRPERHVDEDRLDGGDSRDAESHQLPMKTVVEPVTMDPVPLAGFTCTVSPARAAG